VFYDRFKELAELNGKTVHRATQEIGLSKSTATKWKKTGAVPSGETLSKIASYFSVAIESLLDEDIPVVTALVDSDSVTAEEMAIIKKYRALDKRGKENVLNTLNSEHERASAHKKLKTS
jgi:transcriptional regulator with XRE-family HTH domain